MNFNDPALYWLIGGIGLMILELLLTGVFVIYIAMGCIGGMVASWLGFGLSGQLFGFAIALTLALLAFRPLFNRFFFRNAGENTNIDALVGRKAIVTEDVNDQGGRVLVGGENWRAVSVMPYGEGEPVMVTAVRGATLLVDHFPEESQS